MISRGVFPILLAVTAFVGEISYGRTNFDRNYIEVGYLHTRFDLPEARGGIGVTLRDPLFDGFRTTESFAGIVVTPLRSAPAGYDISSASFHGGYLRLGFPVTKRIRFVLDFSTSFARRGGEALLWEADSNSLFEGNSATFEYITKVIPITYRIGLGWAVPGTIFTISAETGASALIAKVSQEWKDASSSLSPSAVRESTWGLYQYFGSSLGLSAAFPLSPLSDFTPRITADFTGSTFTMSGSIGVRRYF